MKNFIVVSSDYTSGGRCRFFTERLNQEGLEDLGRNLMINPAHPEDFARAAREIKEAVDVVVLITEDNQSVTPDTVARILGQAFNSDLLGLVHAAIELGPVLKDDAKIFFVVDEPRAWRVVGRAIVDMFPAVASAIKRTPTRERLDILKIEVKEDTGKAFDEMKRHLAVPATAT